MTLRLQNDDALQLQDGAGVLLLQGKGASVTPQNPVILPGELGAASYPSFFPCATWEYSQIVSGNMGRTQFVSGWTRQRKRWRENVSSVNLTFEMNTNMFDRWTKWMVNNGYDWFTMYLDRYDGVQVLSEVRLIGPIEYEYEAHDVINCAVSGELGSGVHDYGPQSDPLDGTNDFGNFCVGVRFAQQWNDIDNASAGDNITLNAIVNADATLPIAYQWYKDGSLISGAINASYTYNVPTPDDPRLGASSSISVNATNDCGDAWNSLKITVPPDTACEPFNCDALLIEMVSVEGTGTWDLLDGNDEPVIPTLWDQRSVYIPGVGLTCTDSGQAWGSGTGISRETLRPGVDLDLCEGPYIARNGWNSQGSPSSWRLTPQPNWGSALPNASIAVVAYGIRAHTSTPENHLWRGTWVGRTYNQSGNPTQVAIQQDIRCGKDTVASVDYDALWFNFGETPSERRWALLLPWGFLTSSNPKLIEGMITIDDIQFPPSASQPSVARYDCQITCTYFGSVTDAVTGESYSDSHTVVFVAFVTHESHSNTSLPLSDSRKPYFKENGSPACQYLQGGWDGVYNLSLRHVHGGEGEGAIITGGQNPGRVSSDLKIAVQRNYSDYEQPAYCDT